jgi:hypothetical protein
MKRFFTILAMLAVTATSFGQSTSNRSTAFGVQDASSIGFGTKTLADVASATLDTVKFYPKSNIIMLDVTVLDSCTLTYGSLGGLFYGDRLYLAITNPAQTGKLNLLGNFSVSTGTKALSLTANKHCLLEFYIDKAGNYAEISRNMNY